MFDSVQCDDIEISLWICLLYPWTPHFDVVDLGKTSAAMRLTFKTFDEMHYRIYLSIVLYDQRYYANSRPSLIRPEGVGEISECKVS